jgi:NAD(P)-dependent dehydrogenase (short-subunit alcohol dehydrogenase family)
MFDKFIADGLEILVSNTGIAGPKKTIEEVTKSSWCETMSVCIDAHFYGARRAISVFREKNRRYH